ncbi:hypothetical protein GE09DRAFT_1223979 [Coniochaeta sp. 2T2.1]|nr:hypothetical protein GE09DRAFT_1223979 [Coniochaeta sp. 2T2.1]
MSSHHPRSGSASATPVPTTPSPQPPGSDESSSQPSTSSRSRGSSQPHSNSKRSHQLGRARKSPLAEEQPGLEVYEPPTTTSNVRVGRTRTRRSGIAPSFWSKEATDNPSQFTFYRDPTPTPPEYREREKDDGYVGSPLPRRPGRSSTIALETARTIPPPDPRSKSTRHGPICGLTRRMFFIAVTIFVVLIVGIAVGVGVGVGLNHVGKHSIQNPPPAGSNSSSTQSSTTTSPTTSIEPGSSSSTSTSSSASTIPTATTDCPFINNTIYQVPGSPKTFLRLCGIDYSGGSEAVELVNKPTFSFADCMGNCAGWYGCTGCAWGVVNGDTGADHQCWIKSDLTTGHKVAPDWCFAILQE